MEHGLYYQWLRFRGMRAMCRLVLCVFDQRATAVCMWRSRGAVAAARTGGPPAARGRLVNQARPGVESAAVRARSDSRRQLWRKSRRGITVLEIV